MKISRRGFHATLLSASAVSQAANQDSAAPPMIRVRSASSNPNLLVTAFTGDGGRQTLIVLNRSIARQRISVRWPGATFRYQETASPQSENSIETAPTAKGDLWEVTVDPGAIVTLTGVELGRIADDFFKA